MRTIAAGVATAGGGDRRLFAFGVLLVLAIAVMLPEWYAGTSYSFSLRYNLVWADQIADQMRHGQIYPRWLGQSWDGMGSPTFYFYPPLCFMLAGAIGATGIGPVAALTVTCTILLFAAGAGMWLWLRRLTRPGIALGGAALYLVAPWHLHDIFSRGALAEATVYATLPFVMLALARVAQVERHAIVWLGLAYAALILSHLPVALLASVTVIPAYALWLIWQAPPELRLTRLARMVLPGVAGIGIAAFFLLPALWLWPQVASDNLFTAYYQAANWSMAFGPRALWRGNVDDGQFVAATLALGYAGLAAAIWIGARGRSDVRIGALIVLVCFALVIGVIPMIWELPGLRAVQFPSRTLVIMEFAIITLCVMAGRTMPRSLMAISALCIALGAMLAWQMGAFRIARAADDGVRVRAELLADHRDAPEYLPKGYAVPRDWEGRPDPGTVRLPAGPETRVIAGKGQIRWQVRRPDGGIAFAVDSGGGLTVALRRFWFPHWQAMIMRGGSAFAIPVVKTAQGLVQVAVPRGQWSVHLLVRPMGIEYAGWAISVISLLLLLWWDRRITREGWRFWLTGY